LIQKESERCKNGLTRLMNITFYVAENNMVFRGKSDKLYTQNNGKYLVFVQLLAKFDPVRQANVNHVLKGESADHYCRKSILNELTELMAERVHSKIVKVQNIFSVTADCIPDIS
jgi:hypothetical protein